MPDVKTIILAAGKGTRMRSGTPKVLHPVCGRPILQYVLEVAKKIGSLKTYVVLGHQFEDVKKTLSSDCIAVKQEKLLGTADAVKQVVKFLKGFSGDVVVMCGDTPLLEAATIKGLIAKHRLTKASVTVLSAVVDEPAGYGRMVRDAKGQVMAIREDKDASESEKKISEINVGVYCFKSRELCAGLSQIKLNPKKKEYYLTDIIDLFYKKNFKGETFIVSDFREGLGVNDRRDLANAEAVMRRKILNDLMLSGVTIVDPESTHIDRDVVIGQDTVIRPFTVIENDVTIGKNCRIGPFCHLRPGTRLADHVEIGNFTEVSRTSIGDKTLMKHFSFMGDAVIGKNVNIGAGSITANYDGKNKHQTKISDNAFIGSDSILVAPVSVGKGSMTGAGSVLTKKRSVPDGCIAVGVPARIFSRRTSQ